MSDYGEPTTIDNLLKHLQKEISVDVEVESDESSEAESPMKLRFIVKNTRSPDELPSVVFQNLILKLGIPSDMQVVEIPRLAGGESYVYEHLCRYSDLPLIQYDIKGSISPESLFQFQTEPILISSDKKWALSIKAYKNTLAELDIHKWLNIIPEATLIPEPDTTLSQLKEQEDSLSKLIMEVRDTEKVVTEFSRFQDLSSRNPMRESIVQHRNLILEYLREVERGISALKGLYSGQPRVSQIEAERNKIVSKLTTLVQRIDQATEKLTD